MMQKPFRISETAKNQFNERKTTETKGAYFQKVRFVFQISQSPKKIIPKNYPELEI